MKKKNLFIVIFIFCAGCVLANIAEPDIYFPFDSGIKPKGRTGVQGTINRKNGDLKAEEILRAGIKGKALLIGRPKNAKQVYSVSYPGDLLLPQAGTICFWIKPVNWKGDNKFIKMFVSASGPGQQIYIYKYVNSDKLFFYCSADKITTIAKGKIKDWCPSEWHFVACTWNQDELRLYLDGVMSQVLPFKKSFSKKFSSLTLGSLGWDVCKDISLMDEVKIYRKALPPKDIQMLYNEFSTKLYRQKSPLNIAISPNTVKLDGEINEYEYSFGGTGFLDLQNKKYALVQSRYYLSYDKTYFYLGVKTPTGNKVTANNKGRDSNIWEDDSIELHIVSNNSTREKYQFIFSPNGAFYDSKNSNMKWNAKGIKTACKIKNNIWTFEAAIPLKELAKEFPLKGKSWRMNICRSFKDSMTNTSISPCNVSYSDAANFASLRFDENLPQTNIESLGFLNNNELDFKVSLKSPQTMSGVLKLISPQKLLPYKFTEKFKLQPGKTCIIKEKNKKLPKNNFLKIDLTAETKSLYNAVLNYASQQPVALSYLYTDIPEQKLNLVFKSNLILGDGDYYLNIKMTDEKSQTAMEEKIALKSSNFIFKVPVDITSLKPGKFKLNIACTDKKGKVLFETWELYRKTSKKPFWHNTKVGITGKVPKPWTNIKAGNKKFQCWGRTYSFKKSALLSSLKSQNMELLANPVRLKINGETVTGSECKLISCNKTTAVYRMSFRYKNVKITADIKAEFDGFVWFDISYSPGVKPVLIKSMVLDIPLKRINVNGFDDCKSIHSKIDLCNRDNEILFNNFAKLPSCWLGNTDAGLMIGAKNTKGWYVKNKEKSMEVIVKPQTVTVRLNIVDTPLKLNSKRTFGLYFEATPARPLNYSVKSYRNGINTTVWSGYWNDFYDYYAPEYFSWEKLKRLNDIQAKQRLFFYSSSHGTSPCSPLWNYYGKLWHSSPPALGAYCVDSDVSKRKLRNRNKFTYACLDCKSFREFKLETISRAINNSKIGIRNLYIDLAWPRMCGNKTHGCAWTDEFGDKMSSFDIIGTREYYKRLYNILKAKNPEAVIIMHVVSTRTPAESFADLLVLGESYDRAVAEKESYYDVINPAIMRIAYASRAREQEIWFIPQFTRALRLFRPDRLKTWNSKSPEADRAFKHFMGYMLVHGISFWRSTDNIERAQKVYDAQDWLGWNKGMKFYPYWDKNKNPVKVISGNSNKVMISTFENNGKIMIALLNDCDSSKNLKLKISKDILSRTGKSTKAYDAVSGESGSITDGQYLKQVMPARAFRILLLKK